MPFGTETTIAKMIDYNPESVYVQPLEQGKIKNTLETVCQNIGIELISTDNSFGGLAFYSSFRKERAKI